MESIITRIARAEALRDTARSTSDDLRWTATVDRLREAAQLEPEDEQMIEEKYRELVAAYRESSIWHAWEDGAPA